MRPEANLQAGDVVQINPDRHVGRFGGMFMVITEKSAVWVEGYFLVPSEHLGKWPNPVYYRASYVEIEPIGTALWSLK